MNNTSIKSGIELSEICKKHDIEMSIDESGITLTTSRNGKKINRSYDLNTVNIIALTLPIDVIIDMFIEEAVLKFKRAAN